MSLRACPQLPQRAHLWGRAVLGILTVQKYSSGPCAPAPPNMNPLGQLRTRPKGNEEGSRFFFITLKAFFFTKYNVKDLHS